MSDRQRLLALLPRELRALPADLGVVLILTVATAGAATLPGVRETPLRVVLGLPFSLFLPGYALIAALFPEAGSINDIGDDGDYDQSGTGEERMVGSTGGRTGIDGIERVALAFGLSIAVVPLVGLVLNFTPWGIRLGPILVSVGGVTVVCTAIAAHRRWELPQEERFSVPYQEWYAAGRSDLFAPQSRTDAALNILLVVSILLATASVGYAVTVPKEGESFSELYLLTETDDGELVADDYPTEFALGESRPIVVGIGNHEHQRTNYSVVVELQNVTVSGNSTTIHEERELTRLQTTLADNETWHQPYGVEPTMTGTRLRLQLLLYRGQPPADTHTDNAYRETHLWINVSEADDPPASLKIDPSRSQSIRAT